MPVADNTEATGGLAEATKRFWRVGRVLFGYFLLHEQEKVTRPPGRDPAKMPEKQLIANSTQAG